MSVTSIGDLARSLVLRSRSVEIKQQIETLTRELSSGQVADVNLRLAGDYSYLAEMDRNLTRLDAFNTATAEAGLFASAMQDGLANIQSRVGSLAGDLLTAISNGQQTGRNQVGARAGIDLSFMIATLNGSVGGRALFSGMDTDTSPLADAETLLSELRLAVAGQATPDDIRLAAETWFSDPAGFDALIYRGSDRDLAPMRVSETEQVAFTARADDSVFKQALMATALTALTTDSTLALAPDVQAGLMTEASDLLLDGRDRLTEIRAGIGFAESRVEAARTRNSAARTGLEYTRAELISADPYDVATRLEAAQFQLESLYSATVRTSRLSLVNFLK